ncbi:DNA (cytosine-5-)-methyltransferase [Endozoicomonas sp. (ex Bugula neritina AB1)]|nr:DNA (cytosine-5-)-methyltransferase [Endozoicomonas sp. (ex Bugula neritina AB1)]
MDLGFEGGFSVAEEFINSEIFCHCNSPENGMMYLPETGFQTVFANDILKYAEAAWKPFFQKRGVNSEAVFHTESIVDLVKRHGSGEFQFPANIDVVTGGFPCQDFSVAGKRNGLNSHKSHQNAINDDIPAEESRGSLYIWMRKVIEITRPKVFIAENVKGLVSLGDVKQIIERDFRSVDEGYLVVTAKVLFAPDYGIPQRRERVIFIGLSRRYLSPAMADRIASGQVDIYPPKSHFEKSENGKMPYSQARQAFSNLLEPDQSEDLAQQKFSKAKYCPGTQGQTEVAYDGIAPTIRAEHHGNIEYRRLSRENGGKNIEKFEQGLPERRLSVRECARLQTFPDSYEFVRPKKNGVEYPLSASGAYKVIGNAVPPLLAYHIAHHIEHLWNELFVEEKEVVEEVCDEDALQIA